MGGYGSTLDGRRARITAAELSLPVSYEQAALRELTASTQTGRTRCSKAVGRQAIALAVSPP